MDGIASAHAAGAAGASTKAPKLAERIALQITERARADKLLPGTPLGTEADVLAQYGSSRCTIREAIAILEREGVVNVRRGRGGGLFIAPPDMLAVSHAMRAYFEYIDVSADEIMATRGILNRLAVRLTVERLTAADIADLRKPGMRFWALLKATHNPILDILGRSARRFEILALLRSAVTEQEYFAMLDRAVALQARQAEAVIGGDLQLALELESEGLHRAGKFMHRCLETPQPLTQDQLIARLNLFVGQQRPLKKPEQVTYAIMHDIIGRGWPVGHHLGSEQDMLGRFGVGRSVFREAVRPMEQYGVVDMRTGRQSGLKIAAPTLEKISAESMRSFQQIDTPLASYAETYDALGAASVAMAAGRKGSGAPGPAQQLEQILAYAGGNRVIAVMLHILRDRAAPAAMGTDAASTVTNAIAAGDAALAYRSFLLLRGA